MLRRGITKKKPQPSRHMAYAECPYCDGENVVVKGRSNRAGLDLIDFEIACQHCQSLFALSESKVTVRWQNEAELKAA